MSRYTDQVNAFRVALVRHALAAARGSKAEAARSLGVPRPYVYSVLKRGTPSEPKATQP